MKEITSSQGGRYRYNEDIRALQGSALAMTEFFKQIGTNFVLSGCKNNGDGYAWIDGKIRYVEAQSPSSTFNYIIAEDSDGIDTIYHDKNTHKMNINYGAKYSASASTTASTISKVLKLNDFPRLSYALFDKCSVDKETTSKSTINSPVSISDTLEGSSMTMNVGTAKIELSLEYPYLVVKITINNKKCALRLPYNDHTIQYTGGDNKWSVSNQNEGNSDDGDLYFNTANINNLTVRNGAECDDLQIKTSDGNYLSILDVIDNANPTITEKSGHPINTKTNKTEDTITIRESNGIVSVQGLFPADYINCNSNSRSNYHVGDCFYISDIKQADNNYHISAETKTSSNIQYVKVKTTLKLPNGFAYPNGNRLPGTVLCCDMTDYIDYSNGYENGNIQLMIGSDGYFYILVNSKYNSGCLYFVLNGSYTDDNKKTTMIGAAFNLTYIV